MGYNKISIKEAMEKIGDNQFYLPAIQRRFVWEAWQIEGLFDSIMKGYPIGTFIFWKVKKETASKYVFYKFLQNYREGDKIKNERAPQPELKEYILGVLDGQQRLSSMYVSLQGTYSMKKPYARWDDERAFLVKKLYMNLFKKDEPNDGAETGSVAEEDSTHYGFKLLTDKESEARTKEQFWFPVRQVLDWGRDPKIDEYYDSILDDEGVSEDTKEWMKEKRDLAKSTLRKLHQRLVSEELISYYEVDEPDLDDVLEIFIRVNSYGKPLTKTDLLLATMASVWDNARDEIENFLKSLNKKGGEVFFFDNDFIMRASLVLTDSPVLFKVKGFDEKNIEKIKNQWEDIKSALDQTVDFLIDIGFNGESLTSQNSIIPIAYFVKNSGDLRASKDEIRKYLINATLMQVYSGQGDSVLSKMRTATKDMLNPASRSSRFSFDKLLTVELPNKKTLKMTDEDISSVLEENKGPRTFAVLSLLYPNLRYGQVKFQQDHMHPKDLFKDTNLKSQGVPENLWQEYKDKSDKLPNLQLMEGTENEEKNSTKLCKWVNGKDRTGKPNVRDKDRYLADNYVPIGTSLDFKDFLTFYDKRKEKIRSELNRLLR